MTVEEYDFVIGLLFDALKACWDEAESEASDSIKAVIWTALEEMPDTEGGTS